GAEAARVLAKIPDPRLGLLWDAGNAYHLGEEPFPSGYRAVRAVIPTERLFHVHLKDARPDPEAKKPVYCRFGDGEIDFGGQFRALVEDGFAGVMSLETHWRHPTGNKELASRECLEAIRALIERLGLADRIV
ncbi:MAG TPA: sugar phosphate isomerase/epimerase, partial [Limnochordia bacterium]